MSKHFWREKDIIIFFWQNLKSLLGEHSWSLIKQTDATSKVQGWGWGTPCQIFFKPSKMLLTAKMGFSSKIGILEGITPSPLPLVMNKLHFSTQIFLSVKKLIQKVLLCS